MRTPDLIRLLAACARLAPEAVSPQVSAEATGVKSL
jgi:hypothetical protein